MQKYLIALGIIGIIAGFIGWELWRAAKPQPLPAAIAHAKSEVAQLQVQAAKAAEHRRATKAVRISALESLRTAVDLADLHSLAPYINAAEADVLALEAQVSTVQEVVAQQEALIGLQDKEIAAEQQRSRIYKLLCWVGAGLIGLLLL